ncbi:MAG: GAF domain-containing protein [Thermodesulfobacteriota bacterium]
MPGGIKNIALIGANKEGLKLLPVLLEDPRTRVCLIVDSNRDAMLFKLNELGYRLSEKYGIRVSRNLEDVKKIPDLDVIVNALQDVQTEKFLEAPEFRDTEKLGPLSTRLIWSVRASAPTEGSPRSRTKEQTTLLASLREIVDAVRLTIDRKELLSVILKLATESTRAERGSIMLMSEDEGMLRVEMAKGMDEEVIRKIRVPLGEGVSGRVARDAKAMLISGKATTGEFSRPMERSDVKSAMCVPLIVNGETIGVINVNSNESAHAFTNEDLDFMSNLAGLAAEVIQRSNEYERLRVNAAKFTFWKEVDSIMSSSVPLDKRLNTVARKLAEIIQGLTCFIYMYDEERDRLLLRAASIRDSKGLGCLSLRLGEGMESSGLESTRDIFLVDREEGNIKRVYLTLPMVAHGTLVGTLNGQVVSTKGLSKYHESFLKDIRTLIGESVYKYKRGEKEKMRSRKMFAVDESGLEMISMKDPRKLSNIIATTPAAILGAEGALLRVKRNGGRKFQTVGTFGLDDTRVREYFLPIEKETVMEVLRRKDVVLREFSEAASPYIRSVLSRPLMLDDAVAGVLTLFNKTSEGSLYPCGFSKVDADILARFSVYAEKSLVNIVSGGGPFKETVSPLAQFEQRVEEELNRARRLDKSLVLATVRIPGLKDALRDDRSGFDARFIGFIRKKTRSFDILVKLNEETFAFLFLDTREKVTRLIGSIAEFVSGDAALQQAFHGGVAEVLYGYATFPDGGDSFAELFAKASDRVKYHADDSMERKF